MKNIEIHFNGKRIDFKIKFTIKIANAVFLKSIEKFTNLFNINTNELTNGRI